jgi:hypothetical protein
VSTLSKVKARPPDGTQVERLSATWEWVSPEVASAYLHRNTRNRAFMRTVAERYASDMAAGDWLTTHQGIAFDVNDVLVDGQHRLQAVVLSGRTVRLLVIRGLSPDAMEVIDRMKMRTIAHTLKILGYEYTDNRTIAVARRMLVGPQGGSRAITVTDAQLRRFLDAHLEAILFAREAAGTKFPAAVLAAFARAYLNEDPEQLRLFGLALQGDEEASKQTVPTTRRLRELVLTLRAKHAAGGCSVGVSLYRKTQHAIWLHLTGKSLTSLYEKEEDLFPLKQAEDTSPNGDCQHQK